MSELERLLDGLRNARAHNDLAAIKALVEEAVATKPQATLSGTQMRSRVIHRDPELLILQAVLDTNLATAPHDHRTWAVVGVYQGQEDNRFYNRVGDKLVARSGRSVAAGEVMVLGPEVIHHIHNPRLEPLVALHVYGADIFEIERSGWNPATMREERFEWARHGIPNAAMGPGTVPIG